MGTEVEFMADRRHNLWSAYYDEGVPLGLIRPCLYAITGCAGKVAIFGGR
ncbi:hypothetical protein [Streptomyces agglomeratus]|nr:hypothetical protein [Streptomyces agglomeratus]